MSSSSELPLLASNFLSFCLVFTIFLTSLSVPLHQNVHPFCAWICRKKTTFKPFLYS